MSLRCMLCKGWSGEKEWVWHSGIYKMDKKYHYHHSCLDETLANPQKYSHLRVDLAIEIAEIIEDDISQAKHKEKLRQEKLSKLHGDYKSRRQEGES